MLGDDAFLNVHVYMYACTCHVCVYAIVNMHIRMYQQMHSSQRIRQPFLFDSAVRVMSAAMTNKKAAMVSTQAARTVESCRVATAVGLADLNAWFLGGRDSM